MADKAHIDTDIKLEQMERHLSAIYSRAGKEIEKTAKKYFEQFAELDKQKKKLLDDGKITEHEYKTWRQNKILYGKRYDNLKEQISKQLATTNETALAYINGQLPPVYAKNFNETGKGIESQVKGYSFELTDANTVKKLATENKSLLPEKKLDIPADKKWNTKKMNSEVLQGILQGDSMDKIAKRMRTVTDMNATSAIRNARTMVTGAENGGRLDGMKKAEEDGIHVQKEWLSSDQFGRTRDWHLPESFENHSGLIVDIDEPFENDLGKIMFPGDPSADPANVYNCRCSLGYRVVGFKKT